MYPMKKGVSKTLTGTGTTCQFNRGEFMVSPFTNAVAARFKVRVSLTKSGGDAALTEAQVRTMLEGFDLSLSYGANQQHKPYNKVNWKVLGELARFGLGSYFEGYSNSSTGLRRTIASTATEVTFYLRVPFIAMGWQDQSRLNLWGVGPTQAATMVFEMRQNTVTLPTNFAISGSVTIDVIADEEACAYDRWTYIPEYLEMSETNRVAATLPAGFYAFILDRNAVHASNSFSDVTLTMDGLTILDKVSLAEAITRYRDTRAYFPAEADLSDYWTLWYAVAPGTPLNSVPSGKPVLTQNTHSVATMLLSLWYHPVVSEAAVDADIAEMSRIRGVPTFVIVGAEALGYREVPKAQRFALPLILVGEQDRESQQLPSKVARPGSAPIIFVPPTVTAAVNARAAAQSANGEYVAAEDTKQAAALTVPGAVQSTRGLKRGSRVLDEVRSVLR
jgi:hypothetical protein